MILIFSGTIKANNAIAPEIKISPSFIENKGQIIDTDGNTREDIKFVYNSGNVVVYFRDEGISYVYHRFTGGSEKPFPLDSTSIEMETFLYRMDLEFLDMNEQINISAKQPLETYFNWYKPHIPDGITEVRSFEKIIYSNVYDGIDLKYYFANGSLKYDFIVHPGADPSQIRMKYISADDLIFLDEGGIKVSNPEGTLIEKKPYTFTSYLGEDYESTNNPLIESSFIINEEIISFEIGEYDVSRYLIIDPELIFSTYFGGCANDESYSITSDNSGAVYIIGRTSSNNFPVQNGQQSTNAGNRDVFISKFNSNNDLVWSTYYGGSSDDNGRDIVIDNNGDVVITGYTSSSGFPTTSGVLQPNIAGNIDAFIVKFNSNGSRLWATFFGDINSDLSFSIDIDMFNYINIGGTTNSPNLPGANITFNGNFDGFLAKIDEFGASVVWSTYLGGSNNVDEIYSILVLSNSDIAVTGETYSDNFITQGNINPPFQSARILGSTKDAFFSVFDFGGNLVYSTYLSGIGSETGTSITTDGANVYIAGVTNSDPFPGGTGSSNDKAFVVSFDLNYDFINSNTYGGSNLKSSASDIFYHQASGSLFMTGSTSSTDFPVTNPTYQSELEGSSDVFLMQLNTSADVLYSTYLGGSSTDAGRGVTATSCGIYITGFTESADFPTTSDAIQTQNPSNHSPFLTKMIPSLVLTLAYDENGYELTTPGEMLILPANIAYFYDNFKWYHNGSITALGSSQYFVDESDIFSIGDYFLNANYTCDNKVEVNSNIFKFYRNCDNNPPPSFDLTYSTGFTFNSNTTLTSGNYVFGNITIPNNVQLTINSSEILMKACSRITVEPGGSLIIDNSKFLGCGQWDGIIVLGNPLADRVNPQLHGILLMTNGSEIHNSAIGVYSLEGGIIEINDALFEYNNIHIVIEDYSFNHNSFITNSTFNSINTHDIPCYTIPVMDEWYIFLDNVIEVNIENNNFNGNIFTNNSNAIELSNTEYIYLEYNIFNGPLFKAISIPVSSNFIFIRNNNEFYNFINYGIHIQNGSDIEISDNLFLHSGEFGINLDSDVSDVSISDNTIDADVDYGIFTNNSSNIDILSNTVFANNTGNMGHITGIHLNQTLQSSINMNNIRNWYNGIEYYLASSSGEVKSNQIKNNTLGLVITLDEHPYNCHSAICPNWDTDPINIEVHCNTFWDNYVGIFGTGKLIDQGSTSLDASNWFHDLSSSGSLNIDWDILWQLTFDYFYESVNFTEPNFAGTLSKSPYYMNSAIQNSSDVYLDPNTSNIRCAVPAKRDLTFEIFEIFNNTDSSFNVYPNPFNNWIDIYNETAYTNYYVEITDISGRVKFKEELNGYTIHRINTQSWNQGIYILQLYLENGNYEVFKLIKY